MVAPMNESDLLSPDYDSVFKKNALIFNLISVFKYFWGVSREPVHYRSLDRLHMIIL